ncbi:MAG: putative glycosyltransferase [Prokaryotic dsDNA virus sp.]|nr:MAG: putative glycosyltransferase [Prokaryotic dsDNA virus sp.]
MSNIFVQIASYRDPELIPTIEDCLEQATNPLDLTFGICNQYHEDDDWSLDEYRKNKNFTIMDVPWNESKGLCWARGEIQKMWNGEDYTLQIDSHHRFAKGWDTQLIEMLEKLQDKGHEKPILTSYAGMYSPKDNKKINQEPFRMVGKRFTPSGTILFFPEYINDYKQRTEPLPARFVSGHYFFTLGKHCEEYKYDPNLYFAGDEISLSIRSWTLGYDIFHPHITLVWHEYTREGRVKHWDDFVRKNEEKIEAKWHEMDKVSKKRLRKMLREEDNDSDVTGYDLGTVRTHEEYEKWAGIDFKNRILHPDTIKGKEPPAVTDDSSEWRTIQEEEYTFEMDWGSKYAKLKEGIGCTCTFQFIMFAFEDANGDLLHRFDALEDKHKDIVLGKVTKKEFKFKSFTKPTKLVIWPHDKIKKWVNKLEIKL